MAEFILKFNVADCPICQQFHDYEFLVRTVPLFSGKDVEELGNQTQNWETIVICPERRENYIATLVIPRPERQKIISVKQKAHE